MRSDMRRIARQRDLFRCMYCGLHEIEAGAELTIDHIQPRSQGGSDDLSNLVYFCHACNEFKSDYWQPDSIERILNPLTDDISMHLREDENGVLQSLTATGVFHISRLQLNRPRLIAHRQDQQRIAIKERDTQMLLQNTMFLTQQVASMQNEISALRALIENRLP